jgi:hypothetical protein
MELFSKEFYKEKEELKNLILIFIITLKIMKE